MYDERLDKQICSFNLRFKKAKYSASDNQKRVLFIRSLCADILHFRFGDFIHRALLFVLGKTRFSTANNSFYPSEKPRDISGKKIVVYSCVIGEYDEIVEPLIHDTDVDYYMITDLDVSKDSLWNKIDATKLPEYNSLSPVMLNRKYKILPFELFHEYDYSVYIDGNIQPISYISPIIAAMGERSLGLHYHNERDCIYDEAEAVKLVKKSPRTLVNKQVAEYKKEGFPKSFGLYANTIIVCNLKDSISRCIMEHWWEEYDKFPTRDQISLPYVLWKYDISKENIYILGDSVEMNPRFDKILYH